MSRRSPTGTRGRPMMPGTALPKNPYRSMHGRPSNSKGSLVTVGSQYENCGEPAAPENADSRFWSSSLLETPTYWVRPATFVSTITRQFSVIFGVFASKPQRRRGAPGIKVKQPGCRPGKMDPATYTRPVEGLIPQKWTFLVVLIKEAPPGGLLPYLMEEGHDGV